MISSSVNRSLSLLVFVGVLVGYALADTPTITSISSGLGQKGTQFSVTVEGTGLSDDSGFVFYRDGITCDAVRFEEGKLIATLTATEQCSLGTHPFHIRNAEGLSGVAAMRIVDQVLSTEAEPNNEPKTAQSVALGASVVGTLVSGDVDCIKLSLCKGDRISAEIEGIRLGSKLWDLKLTLLGSDNKPILAVDDTPLGKQDPYLSMVADTDGDYVLQVEASGVDGSESSHYVLHLRSAPRPDYVYPPGGPVGEAIELTILGDPTVQWKQSVTFSESGIQEFLPIFEGHVPATPIPFRTSTFPNVLEEEPNDDIKQTLTINSQPSQIPIAFNGIISKPNDTDMFRFYAEAGKQIKISAFANRVGSPTDTIVRVFSSSGEELTSNDDQVGLDSELVWTPPRLDEYFLSIQEKRKSGGDRYVYRVEITPVAPTVVAFLPRRQDELAAHTITIPQGNRILQFIGVRRQLWSGEAEISIPSLPAGVKATYGRVPANQYAIPVVLEADEQANLTTEFMTVMARAYQKSPSIEGGFEHVIDLVAATADRLYQGVRVDRLPISVVKPASVRINLTNPPCNIPRDGTLALKVQVERLNGFEGEVKIKLPFLPEWFEGPDEIIVPADKTVAELSLIARPEVELGNWPFVATAQAIVAVPEQPRRERGVANQAAGVPPSPATAPPSGQPRRRLRSGGTTLEVCSQMTTIDIAASPLSSPSQKWLSAPGKTLKLAFPLERSGDVPQKLTGKLKGLPAKVSADDVVVDASMNEVVFNVQLEEEAPLAQFNTLVCELSGELEGHQITYRVGRGTSLKIVPPDQLFLDENGQPLSPLEILRKQPIEPGLLQKRQP